MNQKFYRCHILEKKREFNGTAYQLFIDFEKKYEVLHNIFNEFGVPMKLVR
jgi:hypothetical protein